MESNFHFMFKINFQVHFILKFFSIKFQGINYLFKIIS